MEAAVADTVLLIHGDADVLGAVGDYFDRLGYGVGRAATGEAGFEVFERMRPDVVIFDLHVPDQSGLEALERLRDTFGPRVIPAVVTGDSAKDLAIIRHAAGGAADVALDLLGAKPQRATK